MTYEDRVRHRELVERTSALRERLAEGGGRERVTREEARELAALLEELLAQLSPERWDHMMETVAGEAARRAGVMTAMK